MNFNSYIHIQLDICSTQMPQESISTKKIDWILPPKLTWQFSKWTKLEDVATLLKAWGKTPSNRHGDVWRLIGSHQVSTFAWQSCWTAPMVLIHLQEVQNFPKAIQGFKKKSMAGLWGWWIQFTDSVWGDPEDWNHYCNGFFMFQSVSAPFVTQKVHHFHHVSSLFFPLPQQSDPTFGCISEKNATFHGSWESAKICSGHGRAGLELQWKQITISWIGKIHLQVWSILYWYGCFQK